MLVRDIVNNARSLLDDVVLSGTSTRDLLYTDAELIDWTNEAINEAALRTHGLRQARDYVFSSGVARIPAGNDVLSVGEVAVFKSLPVPQRKHILREDDTTEAWGLYDGVPSAIAYMDTPPELWLNSKPITDFTVTLDVAVYLLSPLAAGDAIPLPEYQHKALVNWVLHKAYLKHDAETENLERSRRAENLFDRAFGVQQSFSNVETMRNTSRQRTKPMYF